MNNFDLLQISASAKETMKKILEEENVTILPETSFEVSVKLTTSFGIDLEPNFGCRVKFDENNYGESLFGYGDTIRAALNDFWRSLREWKQRNKSAFVEFEESLMKRSSSTKPQTCNTPCDFSIDACACKKEGGER